MHAVLDTAAIDVLDQSIGESIGSGGCFPHPGDTVAATVAPGVLPDEGVIVVGPIALSAARVAKRQYQVTARLLAGGEVIAVDTFDLARAGPRSRFIEQTREKLALPEPQAAALDDLLDQQLLQLAASPTALTSPAGVPAPGPEFFVVDDPQGPQPPGLYRNGAATPVPICNFDLRILEHVVVRDEGVAGDPAATGDPASRPGAVDRDDRGRVHEQRPAPGGHLRLGPARGRPQAGRRRPAAGRHRPQRSRDPTGDDRHRLDGRPLEVPGPRRLRRRRRLPRRRPGPSAIAQVDLAGCDNAQWLGLRRLSAEQLREVKEHVVHDLLRLHEPSVMRSLLGAAALAPLRSLAAPKSRPVDLAPRPDRLGQDVPGLAVHELLRRLSARRQRADRDLGLDGQLPADARVLPPGLPVRRSTTTSRRRPGTPRSCGCCRTPATGRPGAACATTRPRGRPGRSAA